MPIYSKDGELRRPRLPRLGIIRLGEKVANQRGATYPKATPYFVLKDAEPVAAVFGENPTELSPVFIPVEDEEAIASHWYRYYTQTWGLTCRGDGREGVRLVDEAKFNDSGSRNPANKDTKKGVIQTVGCPCPLLESGDCREVMVLRFMLPSVDGAGVWQISTGSSNSIQNIKGSLAMIRAIAGRVVGVPLKLRLGPQQVQSLEAGKKTVYVLHLELADGWTPLQLVSRNPDAPLAALLPPVVESPVEYVDMDTGEIFSREPQMTDTEEILGPDEAPEPAPEHPPVPEIFKPVLDKAGGYGLDLDRFCQEILPKGCDTIQEFVRMGGTHKVAEERLTAWAKKQGAAV